MAIWLAKRGKDKNEICNIASKEFGSNLNFSCDSIRKTNQFNETCQVTVPHALVCFLESTDFESTIRLAVSIGGDSDTIAAIAGSIGEAYYGIPAWMKEEAMVRLPPEMQKLTIDFYQMLNQKNTKKEPIEPMYDELADTMHETFSISDEATGSFASGLRWK